MRGLGLSDEDGEGQTRVAGISISVYRDTDTAGDRRERCIESRLFSVYR